MKFSSKPIPEHEEVPLGDEGRLEKIVEESSQRGPFPTSQSQGGGSACYILSVSTTRDPMVQQAQLAEIRGLVLAQGDRIVGEEVYRLTKLRPQTLIGNGAAREITTRARACGATMLVLDAELSPSQMRNLEDAAGLPVADREGVITIAKLIGQKFQFQPNSGWCGNALPDPKKMDKAAKAAWEAKLKADEDLWDKRNRAERTRLLKWWDSANSRNFPHD